MRLIVVVALFCAGQSSLAQLIGEAPIPAHPNNVIPDYDFEWVAINRPNNIAYDGRHVQAGRTSKLIGRGSVDYVYRMSMVEITMAQYLEFLNTFSVQSDELNNLLVPSILGPFHSDPFYFGPGNRYVLSSLVPNAGMASVRNLSWRKAAMYCNWLHNNKSSDPSAIHSGAYDTSTFVKTGPISFTDQQTRSPGARFWIPSLDEWLKAVHFDPNRFGVDQPGWWKYPYHSDASPVSGLPGVEGAETSVGIANPLDHLNLPLKSYLDARTPWGLWDASGGMEEWTEEYADAGFGLTTLRIFEGKSFLRSTQDLDLDNIDINDFNSPIGFAGLRVAGAVQPRADMNGDLFVNIDDLAYLLQRWGTGDVGADMNGDGVVGGADLGLMLGAWGR